jgi:hypothetical protein
MQLAKIVVRGRLSEDVLPRTGGIESFGIEGPVIGRHGVRFVIVVDECDAVTYVDGQCARIEFEIFDVNRRDGRKQRRDGGVGAGGQDEGEQRYLRAYK